MNTRCPSPVDVETGCEPGCEAGVGWQRRMQGLALPREQREPRCMDTFIDCGTQVGTVNKCYTGLNGIFLMERECLEPTRFQVRTPFPDLMSMLRTLALQTRMVKPPGRILKTLQGQILKCLQYKRENAERGRAVRC